MGASSHGYSQKSGAGEVVSFLEAAPARVLLHIQLGRLVGVGVNVGEPAIVRRKHAAVRRRAARVSRVHRAALAAHLVYVMFARDRLRWS